MEKLEIKQNTTYIYALGGVGEIGKNMYVVQHNKEIYIIDCGIKFANEDELPGVNGIICSFDYLIENKDKIKGLIVTHAHEDHIGGIPYLLKKISNIKIYGAKLTLGIIKKKLKEHERSLLPHTEQIIDDNSVITSGEFKIEFFRVCHSIPDSFGVYLETKAGKIISTGDFRFDFGNRGDETDILKIARLAERNIDVLLCESTNAEREGFSPSESTIISQLKRIILKAKGRIILSTFASNLGRVEEIIEIAINNNRKICMCGRSMNTNIETSIECGFLQVNKNCFVEQREIKDIPDEQLLILSTGSQGEEMAALNRMSNGKHPWISLKPTDTIIMSSNPIPGNFLAVEDLVNRLYKLNVNVILNRPDMRIHSSGHATQTEQQLMFKLVNPQYIIPIHGEYKMLKLLKENAINSGVDSSRIIFVVTGQMVELSNHVAKATTNFLDINDVYIEGGQANDKSLKVVEERMTLAENGVFSVLINMSQATNRLLKQPVIMTRGCFYTKTAGSLIGKISYSIKDNIEKFVSTNKTINDETIKKIVTNTADFYIWKNKKKKPLINCVVFRY